MHLVVSHSVLIFFLYNNFSSCFTVLQYYIHFILKGKGLPILVLVFFFFQYCICFQSIWFISKFCQVVILFWRSIFSYMYLNHLPTFRCLKTINSKKYGVELVCFTENPTYVLHSSKNGWDGKSYIVIASEWYKSCIQILKIINCADSLRLLSLVNNCFLRYFKGHLDRFAKLYNKYKFQ